MKNYVKRTASTQKKLQCFSAKFCSTHSRNNLQFFSQIPDTWGRTWRFIWYVPCNHIPAWQAVSIPLSIALFIINNIVIHCPFHNKQYSDRFRKPGHGENGLVLGLSTTTWPRCQCLSIWNITSFHPSIPADPQLESVEVARVDFLEAHVPDHSAVFHYLVLLQLQVATVF